MLHAPDLLASDGIDGRRRIVRGHVDRAVLDERKALPALQIGERVGPYRNQLADVLLVDLGEWTVAVSGIPHPVDEDVAWSLLIILELVGGLGERRYRNGRGQERG
jgi:hypothetical protein